MHLSIFMYQHDVRRLPNGTFLMIDDGYRSKRDWARVVEYKIDEGAKTATKVWQYRHDPDISISTMGSAQRLSNGNTVIGWGMASSIIKTAVTEVDPSGKVVWELSFNGNLWASYRALKFDWNNGGPSSKVLRFELAADNSYDWNVEGESTGVSMDLKSFSGFGYNEIWVVCYNYSPFQPKFSGKTPIVLPRRAVFQLFNLSRLVAKVKFDAEFYKISKPESVMVYYRPSIESGEFTPLPTTYNPVTKQIYVDFVAHPADTNLNDFSFYEIIFAYGDYEHQTFPPLLVYPSNNADANISKAKLEWSPVGFARSYSLQIATDPDFSNLVVDRNDLKEAVYIFDASGKDPATYYWRVKTANDAGESEWAAAKSFHTRNPYIKITSPNGGEQLKWGLKNYITWTSITGNDVIIELYKDGSFLEVIDTATNSGGYTWDVPTDLSLTSTYQIKIKDIADTNISDISDSHFSLVGVRENKGSQVLFTDFQIVKNYHNPPVIRYQLAAPGRVQLSIYDILGKKVATLVNKYQSAGSYEVTLDVSRLAPTVYFCKFSAGKNFNKTSKLSLMK